MGCTNRLYRNVIAYLVLLGLLVKSTNAQAYCLIWTKVYPDCPCIAAFDEDGFKLPAVGVVDCSSKNLTSVPQKQFNFFTRTLHELRLSDNQITSLPRNAFDGIKIRHLNLAGNIITSIDIDAFNGTESEIKIVDIRGDSVSAPNMTALAKLVNLEELTMSDYKVTHLPDHYFKSFTCLRELTLDKWGIEVISPQAFSSEASHKCLRSLSLLNQNINGLPLDSLREPELEDLRTLRISGTPITRVTGYAFSNLHSIKEIILSDNKITTIGANSFKNVGDTLQKIDLGKNLLGMGGPNDLTTLSQLPQLRQLILNSNDFVSVPKIENIGSGQAFLLDLSRNKITTLLANGFSSRLQGLDLSENRIVTIDSDAFSGATGLETLVLSHQLRSFSSGLRLPSSLEQTANSLTYLDISGQKVEPQSLWPVLAKLEILQTLIMHSTKLTAIPDFAFQKLTHLITLELSHNSIRQLTGRTFVGPRNLKTLNLRYNNLTAIPYCMFYKYTTASLSLDMGFNYIACACPIQQLLEDYKDRKISFPEPQSIPVCPDGTPMTSVDPAHMPCSPAWCEDYYASSGTDTPPTTDPSPGPTPKIKIRVQQDGTNALRVVWDMKDTAGLQYYKVDVSSIITTAEFDASSYGDDQPDLQGLAANSHISNVCVYAFFKAYQPLMLCQNVQIDAQPTSPQPQPTSVGYTP